MSIFKRHKYCVVCGSELVSTQVWYDYRFDRYTGKRVDRYRQRLECPNKTHVSDNHDATKYTLIEKRSARNPVTK